MSESTIPDSSELAELCDAIKSAGLVSAIGSGRRRGHDLAWRRVELRPVELKAGRFLQVTTYDTTQAFATNYSSSETDQAVADLLALPWGNWRVETTQTIWQLRYTKKGKPSLHRQPNNSQSEAPAAPSHNRVKAHRFADNDPLWRALGLADVHGVIKPSRRDKFRQVEQFVRQLDAAVGQARAVGSLRTPTTEDPWRLVDLGCGNAYLTFAALRHLSAQYPVRALGIDLKQQSLAHNQKVAQELALSAQFEAASISEAELPKAFGAPDLVVALHACDTATDEALARAVHWQAPLVLAAPCCHHDLARQLRSGSNRRAEIDGASGAMLLTKFGILRERFADTLTDALRASLLQGQGYQVEVMEFVESAHTPRNTLLRGIRGGPGSSNSKAYDALVAQWQVKPRLAELLGALR